MGDEGIHLGETSPHISVNRIIYLANQNCSGDYMSASQSTMGHQAGKTNGHYIDIG